MRYIITYNENENETEKRSHRYNINRLKPRHGHKYSKYKMNDMFIYALSNA